MTEKTSYEAGTFCWTDLGTSNTAAAKKFYGEVFGWKAVDVPAGPGVYTMLQKGDKDVCALYALTEQGVPPHWLSYIAVKSADEATKKAESLGAKIRKAPFDVMDAGRMSVVEDPTGATFALWEGKKHAGSRLIREAGTMCWNELMTKDVDKAGGFYSKLFGWGSKTMDVGGGEKYTMFQKGSEDAAGMMAIGKDWGPVPPNWLVYFAVDSCDASVKKATAAGAKVTVQPTDIPNTGRFAVLVDPQGATFGIFQSTRK